MLLTHDSRHIGDDLTNAAVSLAAEVGASHLSVRAIAGRMRMTPQALLNRWETKVRILGIVVGTVAERWIGQQETGWHRDHLRCPETTCAGLLSLLPDEEDLDDLATWLGFLELARTTDGYAHVAAEVRRRERALVVASLRELAGRQPETAAVDIVTTTLDGLRRRIADLEEAYPLEDARIVLESVVNLATHATAAA